MKMLKSLLAAAFAVTAFVGPAPSVQAAPLPGVIVNWWANNEGYHVIHNRLGGQSSLQFQCSGQWKSAGNFQPIICKGQVVAVWPNGDVNAFEVMGTVTDESAIPYGEAGIRSWGFWSFQLDFTPGGVGGQPTYAELSGATLTIYAVVYGRMPGPNGGTVVMWGESTTATWCDW